GVSRVLIEEKQQHHVSAMYYLTKSLDTSRLVISNDGWEHTISDLCTIHNYKDGDTLRKAFASIDAALTAEPVGRAVYANGHHYRGEPILVTEYGGIAYQTNATEGWGYSSVKSSEDLVQAYRDVTNALIESPIVQGFCYTQITDVEQEINGLLTYDRKPKCDLAEI